jgi:hypothetical protein
MAKGLVIAIVGVWVILQTTVGGLPTALGIDKL